MTIDAWSSAQKYARGGDDLDQICDERDQGERTVKKTIDASKLASAVMAGGGERRIKRVIDEGMVKEWVGIGWIPIRRSTKQDRSRYPTVTR